MKYFYFSFLVALCISNVSAQLTVANHAPVIGEMFQRYQCDSTGIVPGPGGANSLWNFTAATHSSIVHSYSVASSTYYAPATLSVASNKSYEDHYKVASNALLDYSSSFPIVSGYYINLNYNTPAVKAKYPMSLNTTSTSTTGGNINAIMITPQAGMFSGTSTTLADGTGTLVLPGMTYTNVIRVVNTEALSFGVSFNGSMTLKNYDFYAAGVKQPVFSIVTVTLTRPAATVRRTLVTRLIHQAPAAPVDITPESDKMVCENMSTTLTVSGAGSIDWFDSDSSTVAIASNSVYVTDPLSAGVYTYYAQSTNFLPGPRVAITFTVNDCTSLVETSGDRAVKIYPNPSAGVFNIEFSQSVTILKVYSYTGRLITSQETRQGSNTLDLTPYPNGIYFVKLMNKDAVISVKKVLVQNNNR